MEHVLETETSSQHQEIQDQYRAALQMWSETKAFYSKDSPEVEAAVKRVLELEQLLLRSTMRQLHQSSRH